MTPRPIFSVTPSRGWLARVLGACLGLAAGGVARAEAPPPAAFQSTLQGDHLAVAAQGRWALPSYGMWFELGPRQVAVYDQAGALCWRDTAYTDPHALHDLLPFFARGAAPDSAWFAASPAGTRYPVRAVRQLPAACLASLPRSEPAYVFDAVTASLIAFYPFAREHHVDWARRAAALRPRVAGVHSSAELIALLQALFQGVEDPHTSISGDVDGRPFRIRRFRGDDFVALNAAYAQQQRYARLLDWLWQAWMPGQYDEAAAALLPGTRHEALSRAVIWGRLDGEVGYLAVNGMGGFGPDSDVAQDRALLAPVLDQALRDLAGTRALVLDVSHNLGGEDEIAADLAARFADRPRPAYSKQAFHGGQRQRFSLLPYDGLRYHAPVYLLTSELTASAAEVFTLQMRELPQVIQLGETTQGVFSDATEKGLPNGWVLSMSTEIYRDARGGNHEGVGLRPRLPHRVIAVAPAAPAYAEAVRWAGRQAAASRQPGR